MCYAMQATAFAALSEKLKKQNSRMIISSAAAAAYLICFYLLCSKTATIISTTRAQKGCSASGKRKTHAPVAPFKKAPFLCAKIHNAE
jgi:hypothetical protein